jgi:soluble lytic murein transglycosylase-like protein
MNAAPNLPRPVHRPIPWPGHRPATALTALAAFAALLAGCAQMEGGAGVKDQSAGAASWRPAMREAPKVLAESDAALYRQAFEAERKGDRAAADRAIGQVKDKLLVGHLLATRYLGDYEPSARELGDWLAKFGDHPDAVLIHRLARRKGYRGPLPAAASRPQPSWPTVPHQPSPPPGQAVTAPEPAPASPPEARSGRGMRQAVVNRALMLRYLRTGDAAAADALVSRPNATAQFGSAGHDRLRLDAAMLLMQANRFDRAFVHAEAAAKRAGASLPEAARLAGAAAWKLGRHAEAARLFETYLGYPLANEWRRAQGAYWAGRAHESLGDKARADEWYGRAAAHGRTLFGMIARHRLGREQDFRFVDAARPNDDHLARIAAAPAGKRALGLVQVGAPGGAGAELTRLYLGNGEAMAETYLALADAGGLADASYFISARQYVRASRAYDPGLYPLPAWQPNDGYKLDRALILAIMRNESAFQPKVVSPAGARGLMQLMPFTAAAMSGDPSLRGRAVGRLNDGGYNMELGQRFLRALLDRPEFAGNVTLVISSYNAGEGAVARWQLRDDPLLYIASVPYTETREYTERVLYSVIVYRLRFGQGTPELEDLAKHRWPIYRGLDKTS